MYIYIYNAKLFIYNNVKFDTIDEYNNKKICIIEALKYYIINCHHLWWTNLKKIKLIKIKY